jgi:hypothetical protein
MEKPNKLAGYSGAGELPFCRILAVSRMAEIAALSMPLFHITAIYLLALAEFVSVSLFRNCFSRWRTHGGRRSKS